MEPQISAVIPTFNGGELLQRCLAALATARGVDEVIVLDGGSTDGSDGRAARWPSVRVVRMDGTRFAHRLNEGVAQARHEHVLVLNDDAFVDPETPMRLAAIARDRPRVGAVGARLRYLDGRAQRSCGHYKTLSGSILTVLSLYRLAARLHPSMPSEAGSGLEWATWLPLCAAVVRKSAFLGVGGFDERFSFYSDDQDFAHRLTDAGWQMVVRLDAGAIHVGGGSTRSNDPPAWKSRYHQNRLVYLKKHYPRGWRAYAALWWIRAWLHTAVWTARAWRHRLHADADGERRARDWIAAYRSARRAPRPEDDSQ